MYVNHQVANNYELQNWVCGKKIAPLYVDKTIIVIFFKIFCFISQKP